MSGMEWIGLAAVALLLLVWVSSRGGGSGSGRSSDRRHRARRGKYPRRDAHEIGRQGEAVVAGIIREAGVQSLHDVYARHAGSGTLAQIDHLVLLDGGIGVVETKAYSGVIVRAGARDGTWLVRYPNGEHHEMPNPIRQNWGHIGALKTLLPRTWFTNIVVFAGDAEFECAAPEGVHTGESFRSLLREKAPRGSVPGPLKDAWLRLEASDGAAAKPTLQAEHLNSLKRRRA